MEQVKSILYHLNEVLPFDLATYETSKRNLVPYTFIGVVKGLCRYALFIISKNVGTLLHCYTYVCVFRPA